MSKKVCPACHNDTFIAQAVEKHDWYVDGDGHFKSSIQCYESFLQKDEKWSCGNCSADWYPHELVTIKKYCVNLRAFHVEEFFVDASSAQNAVDIAHELMSETIQKGRWDFEVDYVVEENQK